MKTAALLVTLGVLAARGGQTTTPVMRLILADKFSIQIPQGVSAALLGPSSVTPYENYMISQPYLGVRVTIFIFPYRVSAADVPGQCTVSTALDRGDRGAAVFCEGQVLTRQVATKLGDAKWIHAVMPNSGTAHSPVLPPSYAFIHVYIATIPVKSDGVIIELYAATPGYKDRPTLENGGKIWPMISGEILPSLARLNCK